MNEALLILWLTVINALYSLPPHVVRFESNTTLDQYQILGLTYCEPTAVDTFGYKGACTIILNDCIKYNWDELNKVYIHELAHYKNFYDHGFESVENDPHGYQWKQIMIDWDQVPNATANEVGGQCTYQFILENMRSRNNVL